MTSTRDQKAEHPGGLKTLQIALIIPTCNAAGQWRALVKGIRDQSVMPDRVIVIDSESTDGTALAARAAGFTVIEIAREDFNHGGTRQLAAEHASTADVLIYLTQDSIPCDRDSFRNLVATFDDPAIGAAFGRQLPREEADPIEARARLFNYPDRATVRSWDSRQTLGFKSIFFSNAFGAYRRDVLMSAGGFSSDVIFGEDTLAIARIHRAGWKTVYAADALVRHSHSYSITEEFQRYFDIGVLHARDQWLLAQFGSVSGEGKRFVTSELKFLLDNAPQQIPSALLRTVVKYLGYKLGRSERRISAQMKRRLSMNKGYWNRRASSESYVVVS